MDSQQPEQQTPEQLKQIKKAKWTMWLGIFIIMFVGLAAAVYFLFLQPVGEGNINANTSTNTNVLSTVLEVQLANGKVSTQCQIDDDCILFDSTKDLSECCPAPTCDYYGDDKWIAVNAESYQSYWQANVCISGMPCSEYEQIKCPFNENDKYSVQCVNNVCKKVFSGGSVDASNWQTYGDKTSGYSIEYPADYLIKMETDGYVVFDPASIDTPNTTYLHISVTAEDNDFYTYRLGILTNAAVDTDSPIDEEDVTIDGLEGKKITLKNVLGETIIHYIVSYLGKVYDISAGDSVGADVLDKVIVSFDINQLAENVDISDATEFSGKTCVSNNDCGAFPCVNNKCLVKECISDSECSKGTCGQYVTPVPGYCTMIDAL